MQKRDEFDIFRFTKTELDRMPLPSENSEKIVQFYKIKKNDR